MPAIDEDAEVEVRRLSTQLAAERRALAERDDRIQELTDQVATLTSLYGSTALAAAGVARRAAKRVLPPGTRRARAAVSAISTVHGSRRGRPETPAARTGKSEATRYAAEPAALAAEYRRWREQHEPTPDGLGAMRRDNVTWEQRPLVSVVLSVADTDAEWLAESIDSVVAQIYSRWELWIVSESVRPDIVRVIEWYLAADVRIHLVPNRSGDTAPAVQQAAAQAQGEWVVRLHSGDLLRPDALHRIVAHLIDHSDEDVVYADEDRLSPRGDREQPEFKPDWSPDYLLSKDYLGCPTAIRRRLLEDVGGWRAGYGREEDHDLHLRATEQARGVGHVPAVLSTRRGRETPPGTSPIESDNPVAEALARRQQAGRAVPRDDGRNGTSYDIRYEIDGQPSVDIIIPTRDRVELLQACIGSIVELSTYPSYRIIIVDNDSVEDATFRFFERDDVRVVPGPGPFNFSRLVNTGVRASDADYVLLLNNDVTVLTADWIEAMLELGQQPDVGAVGCRLLFPDGSVQHEGVALLPEYVAANVSWPWPLIRNTSAVTAACMLVRRDVYWSIGGFDEEMGVVYNDVDFCLRMLRSGRKVLYTPYAQLVHDESASRGSANPSADIDLFFDRWGIPSQLRDPHVSPHVLWPHPQRLRTSDRSSGVLR
jgi:GT2 family glycosyltransferase